MSKPSLIALLLFIVSGPALAVKVTTLTYLGVAYNRSDSATCAGGVRALYYDRKYGCPVKPPTYSVTLSWVGPSARVNGKALAPSELSGYEIYYTTDNPSVSGIFRISGGGSARYVASNLLAGNYYFTMSAVDPNGLKSAMSNLVTVKLGP